MGHAAGCRGYRNVGTPVHADCSSLELAPYTVRRTINLSCKAGAAQVRRVTKH